MTVAAESTWRQRAKKLAFAAIVVQLVGVAIFLGALAVGENARLTLLALYFPRQPVLVLAVVSALFSTVLPVARRRVLFPLQIALCLVLAFPVMGFELAGMSKKPRPKSAIELASYNVYFGKLDRDGLLRELDAMTADVILLQATFDSMPGRVKERFPDREVHHVDDLMIISRFPIAEVDVPPPLEDGRPAKYVGYTLTTPSGPLRVFNVHPFSPRHALFGDTSSGDNIADRDAQAAAVVAAAERGGPPFVIMGDTNLPRPSAIARRHFGRLRDGFDEVGVGFGYTFPAKRPWMRIDRVFAGRGVRFVSVATGPRGNSDHLPLFAEIELVRR
ncbi:MAG: endonuclease/exonuclease/phosphatase family protein [Labilithrix sp.]|nr:endonuclease/exonuclease/phosphatase family protein [Labilithrix sp.]